MLLLLGFQGLGDCFWEGWSYFCFSSFFPVGKGVCHGCVVRGVVLMGAWGWVFVLVCTVVIVFVAWGSGVVESHGEGDAFAFFIDFEDFDFDYVACFDDVARVGDEFVCKGGDVD